MNVENTLRTLLTLAAGLGIGLFVGYCIRGCSFIRAELSIGELLNIGLTVILALAIPLVIDKWINRAERVNRAAIQDIEELISTYRKHEEIFTQSIPNRQKAIMAELQKGEYLADLINMQLESMGKRGNLREITQEYYDWMTIGEVYQNSIPVTDQMRMSHAQKLHQVVKSLKKIIMELR